MIAVNQFEKNFLQFYSASELNEKETLSQKQIQNMLKYGTFDTHLDKICQFQTTTNLFKVGNFCEDMYLYNFSQRVQDENEFLTSPNLDIQTQEQRFVFPDESELFLARFQKTKKLSEVQNLARKIGLGKIGKLHFENGISIINPIVNCCVEKIMKSPEDEFPEYKFLYLNKIFDKNLVFTLKEVLQGKGGEVIGQTGVTKEQYFRNVINNLVLNVFMLNSIGIVHNNLTLDSVKVDDKANVLFTQFNSSSLNERVIDKLSKVQAELAEQDLNRLEGEDYNKFKFHQSKGDVQSLGRLIFFALNPTLFRYIQDQENTEILNKDLVAFCEIF